MLNQTLNLRFVVALALTAGAASVTVAEDADKFSMPITNVASGPDRATLIAGEVVTGSLEVGDTVCIPLVSTQVLPRKVEGLEVVSASVDRVEVGSMAGILVSNIGAKEIKVGENLTTDCVSFSEIPEED